MVFRHSTGAYGGPKPATWTLRMLLVHAYGRGVDLDPQLVRAWAAIVSAWPPVAAPDQPSAASER